MNEVQMVAPVVPPLGKARISSERVLDAAAKLFRDRGYAATTIRDIARESGMRPGSLYYHYSSKEKLLEAVLDRSISELIRAVTPILDSAPTNVSHRARFRKALYAHLLTTTELGDYSAASRRLLGEVPPAVREAHMKLREELGQKWNRLFHAARKAGEIRADLDLSIVRLFLFGAVNSTHEWFHPERGSLTTVAETFTTLLFDGIATTRN